jgi:putative membrane protein
MDYSSMKMKSSKILLLAGGLLALASPAFAQVADLDHSDRRFFEKAAKAGAKEVQVSQAVLGKNITPATREFAQMMVADHTKAAEELKALAAKKGVTLPPPETKHAEKWVTNDKDVDDEYLKEMVSDHKDAVDLFKDAAKSKDADIAAFASKTLPTLEHHLQMVKGLKKNQ